MIPSASPTLTRLHPTPNRACLTHHPHVYPSSTPFPPTGECYSIHLRPPARIHDSLPRERSYCIATASAPPGAITHERYQELVLRAFRCSGRAIKVSLNANRVRDTPLSIEVQLTRAVPIEWCYQATLVESTVAFSGQSGCHRQV